MPHQPVEVLETLTDESELASWFESGIRPFRRCCATEEEGRVCWMLRPVADLLRLVEPTPELSLAHGAQAMPIGRGPPVLLARELGSLERRVVDELGDIDTLQQPSKRAPRSEIARASITYVVFAPARRARRGG